MQLFSDNDHFLYGRENQFSKWSCQQCLWWYRICGTASDKNKIGWGPSSQNGFGVNSVNGLASSNSAASETSILSCFLVSAFDRKSNQLAKEEVMVIFLTNTDLVLEGLMGKIFKLCLILKGSVLSSTEINLNILVKRQVD